MVVTNFIRRMFAESSRVSAYSGPISQISWHLPVVGLTSIQNGPITLAAIWGDLFVDFGVDVFDLAAGVSSSVHFQHDDSRALWVDKYDVLTPAWRGGAHPAEPGCGYPSVIFDPGGFEVASRRALEGFTPQLADQLRTASVVGSKEV